MILKTLWEIAAKLFKKKSTESVVEAGIESAWEMEYKQAEKINFTEIFSTRLTNYTLADSYISSDDDEINGLLSDLMAKGHKWCQMAFGTGRVFLIPYVINNRIYTDIIPQGRAITTAMSGDNVTAMTVLSDVRTIGNKVYYRWTHYEYFENEKLFKIENKATAMGSPAEIPLETVPEWAGIEKEITIENVDKPLFAYVDCPKDNRTTDRLQGAPITFGCQGTIGEIMECINQYAEEFKLKKTFVGIDKILFGKDGTPNQLFQVFEGRSAEEPLFEIFSPDIRDESYRNRLLDLFGRLEKQVGTSNGILTPADTSMATATQVKRSMYDTFAIVKRMHNSIARAVENLCYIYTVYLGLLGIPYSADYSLRFDWGNEMLEDTDTEFSQLMQAESIGAVRVSEVRRFIYPDESPEEAEQAVKEIEESKPKMETPDFFGV